MAAAVIEGASTGATHPVSSPTRPRRGPGRPNDAGRNRPAAAGLGSRDGASRSIAANALKAERGKQAGKRLSPTRAAFSARRKRTVVRQHAGEQGANQPLDQRAPIGPFDMDAGVIDEMHVVDAGGARGHAGEAGQAAVDVLDHICGRRPVVLEHVLDEVDSPAGRIELVAEEHISRTGRGAESAMHAGAQDAVGFRNVADRQAGPD